MSATVLTPAEEMERATSDYLAVSRNPQLYASPSDYAAAEDKAWTRLMSAREAAATEGD